MNLLFVCSYQVFASTAAADDDGKLLLWSAWEWGTNQHKMIAATAMKKIQGYKDTWEYTVSHIKL